MVDINQDFINKVIDVSKKLGCEPRHLLAVIKLESGFNPAAVNKQTNATGLIQFLPSTAKSLGTTVQLLSTMSAVDQMDYVFKYLDPFKPFKNLIDLYLAILLPVARYSKDDVFIEKEGKLSFAYEPNKGLDYNKDGKIDKQDLEDFFAYVMKGPLWDQCVSYLDDNHWPPCIPDPSLNPSQNIINFVKLAANEKWSLSHNRPKLMSLIGRGVDGDFAIQSVQWKTNCATSALGFIAASCGSIERAKSVHPSLVAKSKIGTAVSVLVSIARDTLSLRTPTSLKSIKPGSLLWYGTQGKNDDHFEWVLSPIDDQNHAEHGGGGRPDNAITVSTGDISHSSGRPLKKYIDIDDMCKAIAPKQSENIPPIVKDTVIKMQTNDIQIANKSDDFDDDTDTPIINRWKPDQDSALFGLNRDIKSLRFEPEKPNKFKPVMLVYTVLGLISVVVGFVLSQC